MSKNIFIACDTNKTSTARKIIKYSNIKKLKIGYKFGLEFINSKNGRSFMSKMSDKIIFAYFIGSIVGALFISRFFGGVDIREQGSGNAGANNALLTQGKLFGLLVLIIDFSKGVFACFFLPSFNLRLN